MTIENAIGILTAHRNGVIEYPYSERKQALAAIRGLVTEWIQCVDGNWQLVIIGYND